MVETVNAKQVMEMVAVVAADLEKAKGHLCALDGATGDGDLGVTMVLGCRAVLKSLDLAETDIGSILVRAGTAFGKAAPSSMGALLSSAVTRAGQAAMGAQEIGVADVARMARAAEAGIRERGKAEVGDKTVLDAVAPAVAALVEAAERQAPLPESLLRAEAEAKRGMEQTMGLKSRMGRAAALGDRSIGHPDAGAACVCIMLHSVVDYAHGVRS